MYKKVAAYILLSATVLPVFAEDFFRKNYVYAVPTCENPSFIRWWIDGSNNKLLLVNLDISKSQIETFPVIQLISSSEFLQKGDLGFKYSENSHEIITFYNNNTLRIKNATWNGNQQVIDYQLAREKYVSFWVTCSNNYAANLISEKYTEYMRMGKSSTISATTNPAVRSRSDDINAMKNENNPTPVDSSGNLYAAQMIWELSYGYIGSCPEEGGCLAYARKFPKEYANWLSNYKNQIIRKNRAVQECAAAGDIDRCIKIKMGN